MEFDSDNTNNKGTQTEVSKHKLASKVKTMILRNEVAMAMNSKEVTKVVSSLSYEVIVEDSSLMKHFVGLTEALHNFLNDVCPLNSIAYWRCKGPGSDITKVSTTSAG